MNLFKSSANGTNGTAQPEVTPQAQPALGTGPMMLLRALGLDPTVLGVKLIEFEGVIKSAIEELVARAKTIDESLAEIHRKLDAMAVDIKGLEARADKNTEDLASWVQTISARVNEPGAEQPAGAARATKRAKVQ